jgi:hypothetical protein
MVTHCDVMVIMAQCDLGGWPGGWLEREHHRIRPSGTYTGSGIIYIINNTPGVHRSWTHKRSIFRVDFFRTTPAQSPLWWSQCAGITSFAWLTEYGKDAPIAVFTLIAIHLFFRYVGPSPAFAEPP